MYERILLAYDGTLEGRLALREGALLAKWCGAKVYLLSVAVETAGTRLAKGIESGPLMEKEESYKAVLDDGVARLRQFGFAPVARLVSGDPPKVIGAFANEIQADLVVVGYRRQSALERWWLGPSGAYLVDHIRCSLLVSRKVISDEAFEAELKRTRT